jgi:phosphatidylcholine synthase
VGISLTSNNTHVAYYKRIRHKEKMQLTFKALFVHLFTATGVVFAMFAMLASSELEWDMMCLWLVVALLIDGIDGPLARKYNVKDNCARFDGVLLDLIIDFLTYVFIPAFALYKSDLLPGNTGWAAIIIITFASAMYFADTNMKTKDNSFSGFPGCWNMVVITLFATMSPSDYWLILGIITILAAAMFLPLKFVHPVRTKRWRIVTLPVALLWICFAGLAAWYNFAENSWSHWGLTITGIYLLFVGIAQQIIPEKKISEA